VLKNGAEGIGSLVKSHPRDLAFIVDVQESEMQGQRSALGVTQKLMQGSCQIEFGLQTSIVSILGCLYMVLLERERTKRKTRDLLEIVLPPGPVAPTMGVEARRHLIS